MHGKILDQYLSFMFMNFKTGTLGIIICRGRLPVYRLASTVGTMI